MPLSAFTLLFPVQGTVGFLVVFVCSLEIRMIEHSIFAMRSGSGFIETSEGYNSRYTIVQRNHEEYMLYGELFYTHNTVSTCIDIKYFTMDPSPVTERIKMRMT